eukprot:556911-Amphidinium_carterae.1
MLPKALETYPSHISILEPGNSLNKNDKLSSTLNSSVALEPRASSALASRWSTERQKGRLLHAWHVKAEPCWLSLEHKCSSALEMR